MDDIGKCWCDTERGRVVVCETIITLNLVYFLPVVFLLRFFVFEEGLSERAHEALGQQNVVASPAFDERFGTTRAGVGVVDQHIEPACILVANSI